MSWDELDSAPDVEKKKKEHHEKVVTLAKNYAEVFNSEAGGKVIADLVNNFIMDNNVQLDAPNIDYQAAYKNGEAGAIHYILNQLKKAQYE